MKWQVVTVKWPIKDWPAQLSAWSQDGWTVFSTQVTQDGLIIIARKD